MNVETKCANGKKQVVNKGELEEVVCTGKNEHPQIVDFQKFLLDETFSAWSTCPASCKDRPVPKRFRWSSHGNVQSEDCAASTAECREYKLYNLYFIRLLCNNS